MEKRPRKDTLTKLQEKQAALAEQIKQAKRDERKQALADERKRFAILGQALGKELAENEELAAQLEPLINARVTKASERKFLGLEPLKPSTPSAGQ